MCNEFENAKKNLRKPAPVSELCNWGTRTSSWKKNFYPFIFFYFLFYFFVGFITFDLLSRPGDYTDQNNMFYNF